MNGADEAEKTTRWVQTLRAAPRLRRALLASFSRYRLIPGYAPNIVTVGVVLIIVRVLCALFGHIEDCDETFNYWEPLHYITYGYGFQTWEYAPQFALRSYAFLLPYAAVARAAIRVTEISGVFLLGPWELKRIAFYAVRCTQAAVCAISEASLYDATVWRFGKPAARTLLVLLISSPGMFRACAELLPSSFAMIAVTAATAAWMVGDFERAVFLVAVAAIVGWPFAALLGVGMAVHIPLRRGLKRFLTWAATAGVILAALTAAVDSHMYGTATLSPLNLVLYNVFPAVGAGPDIFGTEDWRYYARNLVLNLHIAAPLLAVFVLTWPLDLLLGGGAAVSGLGLWSSQQAALERAIFLTPTYVWLLVMFNQPHKEERFLAPIYALACLIAAVTLDDITSALFRVRLRDISEPGESGAQTDSSRSESGTRSARLAAKNVLVGVVVLLGVSLGASRIAVVLYGYGAPLRVYTRMCGEELLYGSAAQRHRLNICVGDEWYRFPSNFFLPDERYQLQFVRAGFRGHLPKRFARDRMSKRDGKLVRGSTQSPRNMNQFNKEDVAQYFKATSECHYFVQLVKAEGSNATDANPIAPENREIVLQEDFLDADRSPQLLRAYYIPRQTPHKCTFAKYTVYRNRALTTHKLS